MIAVMTAKWVGDALTPALYEEIAQLKSIPLLEFHTPLFTYMSEVKDIMANEVLCIQEVERLDVITDVNIFLAFFTRSVLAHRDN